MKFFSLGKGGYLFTILLLLLIGCQNRNGDAILSVTEVGRQVATAALATSTTSMQPETATPTTTATRAQPTASVTSTLQPSTPASKPTLTSEQATAMLTEMLQLDSGCPLPCWGGIVPGESQLEAVLNQFKELGFRVGSASAGLLGANEFLVTLEFGSIEGVVTTIEVTGGYDSLDEKSLAFGQAFTQGWRHYDMKELLDRHGIPSHAFLYSPYRADPGDGPTYRLYLLYDSQGIMVQYRGDAEQIQGSNYRACFDLNNVWDIQLFLYEPGIIDSIVEHVLPPDSLSYIGEPHEVHNLIEWQKVTGVALADFYEQYQSSEEPLCIEFDNPFP